MKRFWFGCAAGILAVTAMPASAQSAEEAATTQATDAERLRLASAIVDHQMPPGMMSELMSGMFENLMPAFGASLADMKISELGRIGGLSEGEVAELGDAKMGEAMAIIDPHWQDRFEVTSAAMGQAFRPIAERMEPVFREIYTESYARRFSEAELRDILAFVSTDTGAAFVQHQWRMSLDPETMQSMMARLPEMMADLDFTGMQATLQTATADIPPPRQFDDLSSKEQSRLATLLGISVAELEENWEANTTLFPSSSAY